jgi:hypothetical protein
MNAKDETQFPGKYERADENLENVKGGQPRVRAVAAWFPELGR